MSRRHNGKLMRGRVSNRLDHAPEPDIDVFPGDKERCSESRAARLREHARRIQSHPDFPEPTSIEELCTRNSKLTDDEVRAIRKEGAAYGTLPRGENTPLADRIAARYGVSRAAVCSVLRGLTWKKVV